MTVQATTTFNDRTLMLLEGNLKRVFAMKITRSTFRELQNVLITCAEQNRELANLLFEILLTGQIKQEALPGAQKQVLERIIQDFTIPARLAKEVYERGEFINIVTSDVVTQQEEAALLNRLRRIDGEEFVFLSDAQNTIHVVQHFVGRLHELQANPKAKAEIAKFAKELNLASERLKQLVE